VRADGNERPRLTRFKGWAPLINALPFSLYHFFSPWKNPVRILLVLIRVNIGKE
jgi:hypothetical protein